ncbi:MAG: DUF5719 family protein, partial [Buchananella hordeovulneris]|nr:DUF5719 family protein [Buchananella hordeovulneris]
MRAFTARIGAIVLAGGAVAAGTLLPAPWPEGAAAPVAPAPVELPAAPLHLECPALQPPSSEGELRADGSSLSDDWDGRLVASAFSAAGVASPPLHYAPLVEQDEEGTVPTDDDQSMGISASGPGAKLEVATIRGGVVSTAGAVAPGFQVAAAVELASSTGVYAGLAASPCPAGSTDQWVVGASATVANGGTLRLHNLSARVASVELTMHGARGPLPSAGRALRISSYASVEVQLAALAPGEARPALHVESSAPVAATLLAYETTGLHPAGLSAVHGTTPDHQQVVIVPPGGQVLRIVNPAQETVTAAVSFIEATGTSALPGAEHVEVAPGAVAEIPLDLLHAGALVVTASQPVVASARAYAQLQLGELDKPAKASAPAAGSAGAPAATSAPASPDTAAATPAPAGAPRPGGAPAQSVPTQSPAPTQAASPAQAATPGQPATPFPG